MQRVGTPSFTRSRGFTLVELMVALVLGLVTTLIIAQVVINADGNRRTTISGSDAQVNGSVALYSISRDVQMAGYGLVSHAGALGCPIRAKFGSAAMLNFTLAPVSISVDASGNPTLRTLSAGRTGFSVPMTVTANHGSAATAFTVGAMLGVNEGDVFMAIPATWSATNWCSIFQVASVAGTNPLSATSVPHTVSSSAGWNQDSTAGVMPSAGYTGDNAFLMNLGRIVMREYSITGNNLVMRELQDNGTWGDAQTLASNIVTMRMLYGRDTSASRDGIVDVYDTATPTTADGWSRVLTVRLAVVSRSDQREKEAVTTASPEWDVGTATTVSGTADCTGSEERQCLTLTLPGSGGTDTEWQHHRYKVYDTVVPIRNVLWSAS